MAFTYEKKGSHLIISTSTDATQLNYRLVSLAGRVPERWQSKPIADGQFIFSCQDGVVLEVVDPIDGSRELFAHQPDNVTAVIYAVVRPKGSGWRIMLDTSCHFRIDGSHISITVGDHAYCFCGPINDKNFYVECDPSCRITLDEYAGAIMTLQYR